MTYESFDFGDSATIACSGEIGRVIGKATYPNREDQYLIRYCAADGRAHECWCPEDGIVTEAQTYGGRHLTRQARRTNVQPASAAPAIPAATGDGQDSGQIGARNA